MHKQFSKTILTLVAVLSVPGTIFAGNFNTDVETGVILGEVAGQGVIGAELIDYDGKRYLVTDDGVMQTGWQEIDGMRYYFQSDYTAANGSCVIDGETYWFVDYVLVAQGYVPGSTFEWIETGNEKYYILDNSEFATGFYNIDGVLYKFDSEGRLEQSAVTADYTTDANGVVGVGWQWLDGDTCYLDENGQKVTGVKVIDGAPYVFDAVSGKVARNLVTNEYRTNENGVIITGWQELNGQTCYLDETGWKVTGLKSIDGVLYGFDDNGTLARNASVSGYTTNADGIILSGWQTIDGNTYYINSNNSFATGLQTIDGVMYGFDNNGVLARNSTVGMYNTNSNGVAYAKTTATADNVDSFIVDLLNKHGWSSQGAFNAVSSTLSYKYMASQGSTRANAAYAINNRRGACYHYASLAYELYKAMGYEVRYIVAIGRLGNEHAWIAVKYPNGWLYHDLLYRASAYTDAELVALGCKWDRGILN